MSLILYAGLQYICSEARAGRYWGENSFPTRNLGMILGYDFAIFFYIMQLKNYAVYCFIRIDFGKCRWAKTVTSAL